MSDLIWLSDEQIAKLAPFFPKSYAKHRVDDRRVLSGIILFNRNGLRWRDAPRAYGRHIRLYSRWKRWSEKGIFARMMAGLAAEHGEKGAVMIDATYLKAHRTATSMAAKKGGGGRLIGRTKGGMNTKLHAICDSKGRPLNLFVTAGQVSDYIGARALLSSIPNVDWLLGDRGYDADCFRDAFKFKAIRACTPGRKQRNTPVKWDKRRYKRRNRIEIMFGKLKDWRRMATRDKRYPKVCLSAIALATTVIYWL
ncbi:IS5 family transposase [Ruegeria arenilitoris]|uniref:IS5 family transposase n=1 Tax=Ruegeria arenilitoris TaxID=1173585 RepID=UPI00147C1EDC|nr:IS5 family transposase [Ruegeria arenilitoris]